MKGKIAPDGVSIKFVAHVLNVNQLTVRWWVRRGWLPAYRLGPKVIRVNAEALRILMKLNKQWEAEGRNDTRFGVILQFSQTHFINL